MLKEILRKIRNYRRRRAFNRLSSWGKVLVECLGCTPDQLEKREQEKAGSELCQDTMRFAQNANIGWLDLLVMRNCRSMNFATAAVV